MNNTSANNTGSAMRRSRAGQRVSRFVFTLNNYNQEEYDLLQVFATTTSWFIMGREIGEEGTPHLQGACVIGKQIEFSSLKKTPGFARAHLEQMRGNPNQSRDYCRKEDTDAFEIGALPKQGKRSDLMDVAEMVQNGKTMYQIAQDYPSQIVKYHKGLIYLRTLLDKPRSPDNPPKIYWLHGSTGCGKSRFAHKYALEYTQDANDIWSSSTDLKWFDGYDGQKVAIIDDFRPSEVSFSFFLRILDRYALRVPIKGNFTNWKPEVIIITAPSSPVELFSVRAQYRSEDIRQLERRITKTFDLDNEEIRAELSAETFRIEVANIFAAAEDDEINNNTTTSTTDDIRRDTQLSSSTSTTEPLGDSGSFYDLADSDVPVRTGKPVKQLPVVSAFGTIMPTINHGKRCKYFKSKPGQHVTCQCPSNGV